MSRSVDDLLVEYASSMIAGVTPIKETSTELTVK